MRQSIETPITHSSIISESYSAHITDLSKGLFVMVFDHLLGHQLFLLIGFKLKKIGTEVVCQGENIIRIQLVETWQTKHDKDWVISWQKLFTKGDGLAIW